MAQAPGTAPNTSAPHSTDIHRVHDDTERLGGLRVYSTSVERNSTVLQGWSKGWEKLVSEALAQTDGDIRAKSMATAGKKISFEVVIQPKERELSYSESCGTGRDQSEQGWSWGFNDGSCLMWRAGSFVFKAGKGELLTEDEMTAERANVQNRFKQWCAEEADSSKTAPAPAKAVPSVPHTSTSTRHSTKPGFSASNPFTARSPSSVPHPSRAFGDSRGKHNSPGSTQTHRSRTPPKAVSTTSPSATRAPPSGTRASRVSGQGATYRSQRGSTSEHSHHSRSQASHNPPGNSSGHNFSNFTITNCTVYVGDNIDKESLPSIFEQSKSNSPDQATFEG